MTLEFPGRIAENLTFFTGQTWVLPKLLAWLEQTDDRSFLLTGGPGTGKSMITAWLAGGGPVPGDPAAQEQLERIRTQVAAAHFCVSTSRNTSPRAVAESLANQLTQNIPKFSEALAGTLAERVQIVVSQQINTVEGGSVTGVSIGRLDLGALGDEACFDNAFTQPVKKLYKDGYDQAMILLIDAMDEAQPYTGSINLVQLLSELADLPPRVRFIVTTRSDPRVLKFFRDAPGIDLISDAPAESSDVGDYVSLRLASGASHLNDENRNALAKRIGEAARGVFLYAQMVVDDLLSRLSEISELDYPLPEGLSKLYHDFLNRELGRDEDRWYGTFRPLLGLIAVSRGSGLSRTQLSRMIGTEVEQPLRACKQYLAGDLPEGPFRIFDRSFAEFLLEDPENLDYCIHPEEMHRQISDYYLQNCSQNWSGCDSYGLNHVVDHALASGLGDQERKTIFNRILTADFVSAVQERTGWLFDFIQDLEALVKVEPGWAAKLCFTLVLDRPPNSLVIQHALRLLARIYPTDGPFGGLEDPREKSLDEVVRILSDPSGNTSSQILSALEKETDERVRGVIALALAEAGDQENAPRLLEMFKKDHGTASWAAADAMIALNNRSVIPDLVGWYHELHSKNDPRSRARKQRILYVLGWMHAEEARALKPLARSASDPKIIGRAVDLTWLLLPDEGDRDYLRAQMLRILASPPGQPRQLGPWKDEWLQKRLVRAIQRLRVEYTLESLRRLQDHIQSRPAPKPVTGAAMKYALGYAKRTRLVEAVEEAITWLQIGR